MTEKKIAELIQREIDGALSPDEKSELQKLLASDARMAQLSAQLRGLSRTLEGITRQDTPATLKPSIMRAIEARVSVAKRHETSIIESVATFMRGLTPRGAFAGGLLAGVSLALVAFIALVPATIEETDLLGTALLTESIPVMVPTAVVPVTAGEVSGSLTMEASGRFHLATVILRTDDVEHTALVTYPADAVRLAAVRPDGEGSVPVSAGNGLVELHHQGSTRLELLFTVLEDHPAPLRLTLLGLNGTEHKAEIAFAPPSAR